jgi:lipoprotein NlpI
MDIDAAAGDDQHPLSAQVRETLVATLEADVRASTEAIAQAPTETEPYSRRGDALFFLGRFQESLADYNRMVALEPNLADSHWRRGIACFYAQEFEQAAQQFQRYHTFDDVDRENGIWRYFSQFKAYGRDHARQQLLNYQKDDREPFPALYQLFAGAAQPQAILQRIEQAQLSDDEREKRRFYAELYIGLNYAVEGDSVSALTHLRRAVTNGWARQAGYGPRYMWHVGRVHYELLAEQPKP